MSNRTALEDIEKLMVWIKDERTWVAKDDGEIAQLMRMRFLSDMRDTCYNIEMKIDDAIMELKAAKKIGEIRERLDEMIKKAIG